MIIRQVNYETNLVDIHNIRSLLFNNFYTKMNYIESLKNIIAKHIESLAIDYSVSEFAFTIRIKKTAMKKDHKFIHDPNYYYQIIPNIFREFLSLYANDVKHILNNFYPNQAEIVYDRIINSDIYCLSNLSNINCMADNILVFRL